MWIFFAPEVREVEQHAAVDAAARLDLARLGAGHDIARGQLHRVRRGLRHEAVAVRVAQVGALAAAALGDQHAVRLQRRRVELHELHVLERHARAPGHRHAVARAGVGVRRAVVHAPHAARGEDRVVRGDAVHAARDDVPGEHADAAPAVDREIDREELLVDRDLVLQELLVEHVDEDVPRDVGRVNRARRAGRAERALCDAAVGEAREHGAHVLELVDVARSLRAHDLDRVLVAQVVGALDRVERVDLRAVLRRVPERGVDATLGRAGVGARRMQLRDDRDVGAGALGFDCGAHASKARTDHHDVVPKQRSSRSEGQKRRAEAPPRIIEVACPRHDRRSGDCGTAGHGSGADTGARACARARGARGSGAQQRPAGRADVALRGHRAVLRTARSS